MGTLTQVKRRSFLSSLSFFPFLWKQSDTTPKATGTRRIVTGTNPDGKSKIVDDADIPDKWAYSAAGYVDIRTIWEEKAVPVDMTKNEETLNGYSFHLQPEPKGVIVQMVTLEVGHIGDMHKTDTLDFIVIVSGRVELQMDTEKRILQAGDTVIQRQTVHAWKVIGNEPCRLAAVLLSATK